MADGVGGDDAFSVNEQDDDNGEKHKVSINFKFNFINLHFVSFSRLRFSQSIAKKICSYCATYLHYSIKGDGYSGPYWLGVVYVCVSNANRHPAECNEVNAICILNQRRHGCQQLN